MDNPDPVERDKAARNSEITGSIDLAWGLLAGIATTVAFGLGGFFLIRDDTNSMGSVLFLLFAFRHRFCHRPGGASLEPGYSIANYWRDHVHRHPIVNRQGRMGLCINVRAANSHWSYHWGVTRRGGSTTGHRKVEQSARAEFPHAVSATVFPDGRKPH